MIITFAKATDVSVKYHWTCGDGCCSEYRDTVWDVKQGDTWMVSEYHSQWIGGHEIVHPSDLEDCWISKQEIERLTEYGYITKEN